MDDRKQHVGLYVILALGAALAGCVTVGRPLQESRSRPATDAARMLAQTGEVPLVPVPPPPLAIPSRQPAASLAPPVAEAVRPSDKTGPITLVSSKGEGVAPPSPETGTARGSSAASPAAATAPPGSAPPKVIPTAPQLLQVAQAQYAGIDSYIVRLTRRELVKEKINPDEVMVFKFRKQPWSVSLKWLSKHGRGREVVYVKGRYEGKIHTLLAAGDIPFMPAGRRMALAPDNVLVRSSTRHPITEAGIGACIDRLGLLLAAVERGDRKKGSLQVVGPTTRPEFDRDAYGIEHTLPPGLDPSMPRGGVRTYFFHPENQMPALIVAKDDRGREVEYYNYDRLQPAVKLDDDDFDPDRLWAKPAPRTVGR